MQTREKDVGNERDAVVIIKYPNHFQLKLRTVDNTRTWLE